MFKNCKNTKAQGNIGLGEAIAYFLRQGCTVSIPINDSQDYDLVADIDGLLSKVQVKTTKSKSDSGNYIVTMKHSGGTAGTIYGRVSETNIDYLFCLTDDNSKYLIPFVEIEHVRSSITLGNNFAEYLVE